MTSKENDFAGRIFRERTKKNNEIHYFSTDKVNEAIKVTQKKVGKLTTPFYYTKSSVLVHFLFIKPGDINGTTISAMQVLLSIHYLAETSFPNNFQETEITWFRSGRKRQASQF